MAKKVYEESYIAKIAQKIRELTGGNKTYKTSEMTEGVGEVYEAGKKSEYDAFWDAYQNYGNRIIYVEGFMREGWNAITYNPKYPIIGTIYGLQSIFSNSDIVNTKVPLILRSGGSLKATFNNCVDLICVPSLTLEVPVTECLNAFNNCAKLEEIIITCVGEGCIAGTANLQWSKKLTHDSLMSIINALKDNSGTDTWLSITLGAENLAKLTDEEIALMESKQWNYS